MIRRTFLGLLSSWFSTPTQAQVTPTPFPQTLPPNSVVGRIGAGLAGPAEAIPFSILNANLFLTTPIVMGQTTTSPLTGLVFSSTSDPLNGENFASTLYVMQADPGSHSGVLHSASSVFSVPVGSGTNAIGSADNGLIVELIKQNFHAPASSSYGELDGVTVYVRNTAPTETSAEVNANLRSDAVGYLADIAGIGQTGFVAVLEGIARQKNYTTPFADSKRVRGQLAIIDADSVDEVAYGANVVADLGACNHAYLAQVANGGTWVTLFKADTQNATTGIDFTAVTFSGFAFQSPGFSVDSAGDIDTASVTCEAFMRWKGADLTLANGLNSNIAISRSRHRVVGPTGGFSVGGFVSGSLNGLRMHLYNSVAQAMTIVNEDASSTDVNRIKTLTGGNVVLRSGTSFATLSYDLTDQRWILESTN